MSCNRIACLESGRQKGWKDMSGYLIKDTTREEREKIVADALGVTEGLCDTNTFRLEEMYQDYIDGKKEIAEINAEFRASYVQEDNRPQKEGCSYAR